MKSKRFLRCILFAALMIGLVPAAMMAAEGDAPQVTIDGTQTNYTISTDTTLVVAQDITLDGANTASAFNITGTEEIPVNVTLVFENNATLTLKNYTDGFVIENATLTGQGWNIVDATGMDVIQLNNNGSLDITGNVQLTGAGKDNQASRGIAMVNSSGQTIEVADGATLAANGFYRGLETSTASNYTIQGDSTTTTVDGKTTSEGMYNSVLDFSDNAYGMALSYFDSSVNFKDCKLEVSDCDQSGIYMRQDNGFINGLYFDQVFINCVNGENFEQADIAVRLHSAKFEIKDCNINIENARNTALWLCDGLWSEGSREILDTTITIKNVEEHPDSSFVGNTTRRKAITIVPWDEWTIDGCTIDIDGVSSSQNDAMQVGLNIASDIKVDTSNLFNPTAKASYFGGLINISNTEIYTKHLQVADIGVQIGQSVNIGENVMIDNDNGESGALPHYTILCDDPVDKYPVTILGIEVRINYDTSNLSGDAAKSKRVTVSGGSFYSSQDETLEVFEYPVYKNSIPINVYGEDLTMFALDENAYSECNTNGTIEITSLQGQKYNYKAEVKSPDEYRYIWAPAATVSFVDSNGNAVLDENGDPIVKKALIGHAFGLVNDLPEGNWSYAGNDFDLDTVVAGDISVVQA